MWRSIFAGFSSAKQKGRITVAVIEKTIANNIDVFVLVPNVGIHGADAVEVVFVIAFA
jgi:hypothetical protein